MTEKKIRFKILRYKPGAIDPPRYDSIEVTVGPRTTVLDALEDIRVDHDSTLMYRHSCHHACCGTCAYKINGQEGLGCVTNVLELGTDEVVVEPMDGLSRVVDLVVGDCRGVGGAQQAMVLGKGRRGEHQQEKGRIENRNQPGVGSTHRDDNRGQTTH